MSIYTAALLAALVMSSCLRLDSLLYNPITTIDGYYWDEFEGANDIDVEGDYEIADSNIHLMTLQSDPTGDNKEIYAVYVGEIDQIRTDTIILYCHGNFGHMDFYWPRIKLLANAGGKHRYGVMAMDYRGFGLSEGPSSEEGMYADVDACMKWLEENGLTSDRFVIYGFSLGSAPATELTANPRTLQPSKLMLEACFASDETFTEDATGLSLPGAFVSSLEINNGDEIRKVEEPLFWIHGTIDDFIQIKTHGETVFANHNGAYKEAHRIEGGNHGDVPFIMGYEAYIDAVNQFITRP